MQTCEQIIHAKINIAGQVTLPPHFQSSDICIIFAGFGRMANFRIGPVMFITFIFLFYFHRSIYYVLKDGGPFVCVCINPIFVHLFFCGVCSYLCVHICIEQKKNSDCGECLYSYFSFCPCAFQFLDLACCNLQDWAWENLALEGPRPGHTSSSATGTGEVPEPALGTKLPNSAGAAELPN